MKKTGFFCVLAVCVLVIPPIVVAFSVPEYQSAAQKAASQEDMTYFKRTLGRSYNYTELIRWENQHITFSKDPMQRNTDPIKILEYGKGKCMEFSILYAALCISQGYQCRIVSFPLNDHATNEVKNGSRWIPVDVSANPQGYVDDPLIYEREGQTPRILGLAFEGSSIVEVTATYRSDHWNILSPPTLVVAVVTVWCFFCACFVWSNKRILLKKATLLGRISARELISSFFSLSPEIV